MSKIEEVLLSAFDGDGPDLENVREKRRERRRLKSQDDKAAEPEESRWVRKPKKHSKQKTKNPDV